MGNQKHFERFALTLLGAAVAALYALALSSPEKARQDGIAEWVPLPPKPEAIAIAPLSPLPAKLDRVAVGRRDAPPAITVAELRDKLGSAGFDLGAIREDGQPVPRLFVEAMPRGFSKLTDVSDLKRTFVKMVLPLTLKVNEEILADRRRLLRLQKDIAAGSRLSSNDRDWLAEIAARYDTAPDDLETLLRRVDVISPALALAQSAEESGWGRSRFAVKGNALFGQRTWEEGLGLVPHQRSEDGRFEVRAFSTLLDSVRSYARNLNSHPAYRDFRVRRAEMRARSGELDPYRLVETLTSYSERREKYVENIQTILRVNQLEDFDGTSLEEPAVETTFLSPGDGGG